MPARIFKHACVRDLAWAGFSPPMIREPRIAGFTFDYAAFWRSHLASLDADPAPLLDFLGDAPGQRLGIYYERLWHYLLARDPDTELLAHNLPVREGGQTIGEFDCLFWSKRLEAHVHLELAVKFYLGIPGRDCWLGPGGRDRLDIKLEHLLARQSRLAAHPAAREPLNTLGITSCVSLIDIKGYLFVPVAGMHPPPGHNAGHLLHHWYTLQEFAALQGLPGSWAGWRKIPRRRWLSPYRAEDAAPHGEQGLMETLQNRLAEGARPVQLAACDESGLERYRCFVAPEGWPAL